MSKAVVILSGGQDSTTCLYWAKEQFKTVYALSFDYGQRHKTELESARAVAALAKVEHEIIDLGPLFAGLSPLTAKDIAVPAFASPDALTTGLQSTFVPGRNLLFLAVAANRAFVLEANALIIGVSQEDFGGYPDCRKDFIEKMESAIRAAVERPMRIVCPLMFMTKAQSVLLAQELTGCMEALALTTTCYNGCHPPCGTCHACHLRARGFLEAEISDPALPRQAVGANHAR